MATMPTNGRPVKATCYKPTEFEEEGPTAEDESWWANRGQEGGWTEGELCPYDIELNTIDAWTWFAELALAAEIEAAPDRYQVD